MSRSNPLGLSLRVPPSPFLPLRSFGCGFAALGFLWSQSVLADLSHEAQLEQINKRLEEDPENQAYLLRRAIVYRHIGRSHPDGERYRELSLEGIDQLIDMNPKNGTYHFEKGLTMRVMSRDEDALASFSKTVELGVRLSEVYVQRGALYRYLGKLEEARKDYREAFKYRQTADFYLERGNLLEESGHLDEAVENYVQGLASTESLALREPGVRVFLQQGKYDKALSWIEPFLKDDSFDIKWRLLQAEIFSAKGNEDQAQTIREKTLKKCDEWKRTKRRFTLLHQLGRAQTLAALNRIEEAEAELAEVLEKAPNYLEAKKLQAKLEEMTPAAKGT